MVGWQISLLLKTSLGDITPVKAGCQFQSSTANCKQLLADFTTGKFLQRLDLSASWIFWRRSAWWIFPSPIQRAPLAVRLNIIVIMKVLALTRKRTKIMMTSWSERLGQLLKSYTQTISTICCWLSLVLCLCICVVYIHCICFVYIAFHKSVLAPTSSGKKVLLSLPVPAPSSEMGVDVLVELDEVVMLDLWMEMVLILVMIVVLTFAPIEMVRLQLLLVMVVLSTMVMVLIVPCLINDHIYVWACLIMSHHVCPCLTNGHWPCLIISDDVWSMVSNHTCLTCSGVPALRVGRGRG